MWTFAMAPTSLVLVVVARKSLPLVKEAQRPWKAGQGLMGSNQPGVSQPTHPAFPGVQDPEN